MPVHLNADDENPVLTRVRDPAEDRAIVMAGVWLGVRAAVWITLLAMIILPLALKLLSKALIAGNKLFIAKGPYWTEALMPAVIITLLGAITGGALAWRITSSAGSGWISVWLIATTAILIVLIGGIVTLEILFTPAVPVLAWISLGGFTAGAIVALFLFMHWVD